jgi:DNA polymerase/3'-5' exonuclease PolX
MDAKTKYPRAEALAVARQLVQCLQPCCSRLIVAGSLRRRKAQVGDVEILYIPTVVSGPDMADLFGPPLSHNAADVALAALQEKGVLGRRLNAVGSAMWGERNKLAVHLESGIPVDLFAASPQNWWNLVVCRTGGMQSNIAICQAAIARGWKWEPYSEGFRRPHPERNGSPLVNPVMSEREVFDFVGLGYREPWERS